MTGCVVITINSLTFEQRWASIVWIYSQTVQVALFLLPGPGRVFVLLQGKDFHFLIHQPPSHTFIPLRLITLWSMLDQEVS